jgi:ABC-2 type transport system permease protein
VGVYWAIGVRSFRRFSTYRIATASGAFTNTVFGFILCGVYLTLWHERPGLGGYDVPDAMTFVWLQQGLLKFPSGVITWVAVAAGLMLGILVSFGIRYLVALSGFWIMDSRGMEALALMLSLFFSGTILPLVVFPGWIGEFARATPWAATLQVPIDIWLGRNPGGIGSALVFQLGWILVLLLICQLATSFATRKVVIQGG